MNALIINAHQPYPFSEGKLNGVLVDIAAKGLKAKGYDITHSSMTEEYDVAEEVKKHQDADVVVVQAPVNWMGVPWSFKKYMDEVYTAGMGGELCAGDGRHRDQPDSQYGTGGTLSGKKYMLSLTFNAPEEAFDDPDQWFFQGKSVDDLFLPQHLNFRFFGMEALPTFVCYDVMKNPQVEQDLENYKQHVAEHF